LAYLGKYETPAALIHDDQLSSDEKIAMLESWRNDKEAYLRASDEGMEGPDRSDFLQQIENALLALREDPPER
jgi:hypothetical protein